MPQPIELAIECSATYQTKQLTRISGLWWCRENALEWAKDLSATHIGVHKIHSSPRLVESRFVVANAGLEDLFVVRAKAHNYK